MTDRRRAAARRVREIAARLRTRGKLAREERSPAIARVTGELAGLAAKTRPRPPRCCATGAARCQGR